MTDPLGPPVTVVRELDAMKYYYCNRCDYGWTSEHPPYCPYCNGEPTHERIDEEDADND